MSIAATEPNPEGFDSFGPLLRYLRVRARLSQRELSIAVGYSEAHISRLEQGHRRPDAVAVRALIVPALGLDDTSAWATRLIALAANEAQARPSAQTTAPSPTILQPPAPTGVVATKLYRPQPRPGELARQRLLQRLDAALKVALTLVAAPAGFGKTTLIAAWLNHIADCRLQIADLQQPNLQSTIYNLQWPKAAWLSLDSGDNELVIFLRHLIAALQRAAPSIGADTLALLEAPETPPLRALLVPLINDLAAQPHHIVLALDDYHVILNAAVNEAVGFLIEHMPSGLHLVIITRTAPLLPLARLRVRGQLLELRARDLRFTVAETADFLHETMGLGVSAAEAALLEARTEGWVAGLQLAALALREQTDRATFVAAFAGSNRYVLDYLAEEVLDRLPDHLRSFLLKTSILERFCGELCDAVLGIENAQVKIENEPSDRSFSQFSNAQRAPDSQFTDSYSQHIIAELDRLNLFLTSLDSERRWYRYHQLFADVLRARLRSGTRPEQVAALYRRANAWFWRHNQAAEAIACALAGPDYALAAEQLEAVSPQLLERGESTTLLDWAKSLPEDVVQAHPALALACAWALFHTNQWNAIAPYLAHAQARLPITDMVALAAAHPIGAEIVALRGCVEAYRTASSDAIAWCELALRELPEADLRVRSAVQVGLSTAYYTNGKALDAVRASRAAIEMGAQGRYLFPTIHAHYYSMSGLLALGWLTETSAEYEQSLRFAAEMGSPQSPALGMVLVMQGRAAYERNDLVAADSYLTDALARCQQLGYPEALADAHIWRARLAQILGDDAGVTEHIRHGQQIVNTAEVHPLFVSEFVCSQIMLLISRGALAEAEAVARTRDLGPETPIEFRHQPELVALARLYLAQGRCDFGIDLLQKLLHLAGIGALNGARIEALVPLALAFEASNKQAQAIDILAQALAIAEPEGYVRIFLNEGQPMAALLQVARARNIHPAYCDRLLGAFAANAA